MAMQIAPRTVVEALLPFEGRVALAEVYDQANLTGLDDQPVRLAIRRLVAAGDVVQHGRGRAGSLTLTDSGRRRLQRDRQSLALAFAQDAGHVKWDGLWYLIAVSAPESDRSIRDSLRRELVAMGAVTISTGLYVSPHDLRKALPVEAAANIATATTADLAVQGMADPMLIAEALWPRQPVIDAYQDIEDAVRQDAASSTLTPVVGLLHLAEALERAMRHDPLIPLDLRGQPWPPSTVRGAWARRWEELSRDGGAMVYPGWWPPVSD